MNNRYTELQRLNQQLDDLRTTLSSSLESICTENTDNDVKTITTSLDEICHEPRPASVSLNLSDLLEEQKPPLTPQAAARRSSQLQKRIDAISRSVRSPFKPSFNNPTSSPYSPIRPFSAPIRPIKDSLTDPPPIRKPRNSSQSLNYTDRPKEESSARPSPLTVKVRPKLRRLSQTPKRLGSSGWMY
ncbi:hypothetical protein P9112_013752 [Eukaryota sp. TZLM1-RC]